MALVNVFPKTAPQDAATTNLIHQLRDDTIPEAVGDSGVKVLVGGDTAIFVDFAHVLSAKLPLFIALVVILSFILLSIVFRSFVIPLTAAAMNLLSIGAAFGILVAVYQWGDVDKLFGINRTGPVESFIPVMLFAILFGLSMDYQVFLVSRMHEEYLKSGDNRTAVRNGLAATGKTITAAALIMILVFGSFVLGGQAVIKEFGIGSGRRRPRRCGLDPDGRGPLADDVAGQGQLVVPEEPGPDAAPALGRRRRTWRTLPAATDAGPRTGLTARTRTTGDGGLPGVILGGGLVAGEELVELGQDLVVQGDVDRIEGTIELLDGAWPDDGSGDRRPGEQPGQGNGRGLLPDLVAELFVPLELGAVRLEGLGGPALVAATPSRSLRTTPPSSPPCNGDHGMTPSP